MDNAEHDLHPFHYYNEMFNTFCCFVVVVFITNVNDSSITNHRFDMGVLFRYIVNLGQETGTPENEI